MSNVPETHYTSIDDAPAYLSADQLAALLGIGRATAYRLMHRKGFPVTRLSQRRMAVEKSALIEWTKHNTL